MHDRSKILVKTHMKIEREEKYRKVMYKKMSSIYRKMKEKEKHTDR